MTRIKTTTMATINRMWMNPPIVYDVTTPRSHNTSKTIKSVESIWTSTASYLLGSQTMCSVVNSRPVAAAAMLAFMARNMRPFNAKAFLDSAGLSKKIVEYGRNEAIFAQGDAGDSVMYIQQGGVKLSVISDAGREAVVAMLGPGDFFGEGCLAGQPVRIGSAAAITPSRVLVIEKKQMIKVLHDQHALSDRFISHMLSRNVRIEQDLIDQLFNSSEKRLARALLLLARYGKQVKPRQVVAKISQETLSEMVGTTRSRVNFFMNKFKKLGFIEYSGDLEAGVQINSSLLSVVLHD
jgi:CRP/FNR family transcriptional regulator, cyclic AMP receptor protein